jgi:hypothetical protein
MRNNLIVNRNCKVYVLCPANIATGGPELLHQLVYCLRKNLFLDAYMVYMNTELNSIPIHKEYINYNNPYINSSEIEDDSNNILITPEVNHYITFCKTFKKNQKVLWWLSVDNYYNSFHGLKKKINKFLVKRGFSNHNFFDKSLISFDLHLVQSFYAKKHLESKGIFNIEYLSDFLNSKFLKNEIDLNKKENIIAYNPKKGFKFTSRLIKKSDKKFKFIPIENMTRDEVISLLKKAKVYIDFGFHPGKDRIPREAAILKCCIITGKRGSSNYFEDVSIFDEYKFKDSLSSIPNILNKIEECISNYDKKIIDFESYIKKIENEENLFNADLKKVFKIEL